MAAKLYRTKPNKVWAEQFDGTNVEQLVSFTDSQFRLVAEEDRGDDPEIIAEVFDTLHSTWVGVKQHQYIIKGTMGEFYPCAPEVFEQKYKEA